MKKKKEKPQRDLRVDVTYGFERFHTRVNSSEFRSAVEHVPTREFGYLPHVCQNHIAIQVRHALKKRGTTLSFLDWNDFTIRVCDAYNDPGCIVKKP